MIGAKPTRLCFTPTLPCVDCRVLTAQGLIYPMSSQVWQLLPLCSKDIGEPGPAGKEEPFASVRQLRQLITDQIQVIEHLQRRRRRIAHAYVRLRREHAHAKAQRALRWRLRRICQRQQEVWRE